MLSNSLMVRKTQAWTAAIYLTTFKNRASLLRGHKTVQNVCTNVRALHCDNLDHIRSRLNNVHVHYLEETVNTKTHATNARHRTTYAKACARLKRFRSQSVVMCLCANCERGLRVYILSDNKILDFYKIN